MSQTLSATLATWLQAQARSYRAVYECLLAGAGAFIIALSAQVAIPLPGTPVPVTAQTLAVLLLGASLGARRGAVTVALYLAAGLGGLPLFAMAGGGLARLAGPTGGYLVGFLAMVALIGWLTARGWCRTPLKLAAALVLAHAALYLCGLPWLALYVGWPRVLALGLVPFLAGDALKLAIALGVLAGGRWLGRAVELQD